MDVTAPGRGLAWAAQPGPQHHFVTCPVFEVVYGGARGGGKTDASLGDFALHAAAHGRFAKGLFVRRTRVALEPTIARAKEIYLPLRATWREQKSCFEWPTGARLYFRYLDRDADADAYQGHDYTRVYVEELTQFADPRPIEKLKATLRSAQGAPTGFRATCNPGGPGHTWVKARYIDVGAWRPVRETFQSPFGGPPLQLTRLFIPAKLTDNPICAAASSCQGFCRAELQMFRTLLGEKAEVERVEHLLSGARRCAYRIRSLAAA